MKINQIACHRVLFALMACSLLVTVLATHKVSAQDHVCGSHSTDWHHHEGDGYLQSWFKIEIWQPNHLDNEEEQILYDDWDKLVDDHQFANQDCEPTTVTIELESSFLHKVEIVWGGEIHAAAESLVFVIFTKAKGECGAKVDWHRSGSSTKSETIRIRQQKSISPCKYIEFYYENRKVRKEYTANYSRARYRCRDHSADKLGKWHFCQRRPISCVGQGYIQTRSGWRNSQKICECDNGNAINHVPFDDSGKPVNNDPGSGTGIGDGG